MNRASVTQIIILLVVCGAMVFMLTAWFQRTNSTNSQLLNLQQELAETEFDGPLSLYENWPVYETIVFTKETKE